MDNDEATSEDEDAPLVILPLSEDGSATTNITAPKTLSPPPILRRISSRVQNMRTNLSRAPDEINPIPVARRPVHDRWFYAPDDVAIGCTAEHVPNESSSVVDTTAQESFSIVVGAADDKTLTPAQVVQLVKRFNTEGRNRRKLLKARVKRAWEIKRTERSNAVENYNHTPQEFSFGVVRGEPSPDGIPESSTQRVTMTPHEVIYGISRHRMAPASSTLSNDSVPLQEVT
jgi:hypothetical protein